MVLTVTAALVLALLLMAFPIEDDNGGTITPNPIYGGFYNSPTGRVAPNARRLTINNAVASKVFLFNGTVEKENYIGMVSSLGSVKLKNAGGKILYGYCSGKGQL